MVTTSLKNTGSLKLMRHLVGKFLGAPFVNMPVDLAVSFNIATNFFANDELSKPNFSHNVPLVYNTD